MCYKDTHILLSFKLQTVIIFKTKLEGGLLNEIMFLTLILRFLCF